MYIRIFVHKLTNPRICGKNQKIKFVPLMHSACLTLAEISLIVSGLCLSCSYFKETKIFLHEGNQLKRQWCQNNSSLIGNVGSC